MRGHGQSFMPETAEGHSSKLYADDFKAVCEAFNVTKPVFAGWCVLLFNFLILILSCLRSLGGCIAADICTHLGSDYISGIVYLAAMYALDSSTPRVLSTRLKEMMPGLTSRDDVTLYKRTVLQFADGCFFDPSSVPYETRVAWIGAAFSQPPVVASLVLRREQDPQQLFEAGKKGLRCLYLHGKEDNHRTSPRAVAEELKPYFGDAMEVVEVDNAGHAFFFEQPQETNRLLLDFVKKVNA